MGDINLSDKDITRFWSKVAKAGDDACWEWKAGLFTSTGYGMFNYTTGGKQTIFGAHRASWIIQNGQIPDGMVVRHRCDNPKCVNPSHLLIGTSKDNSQDMKVRGRSSFGEKHGRVRLTKEQVLEIRAAIKEGTPGPELAKKYGVAKSTIHMANRGDNWSFLN